MLLLSRSLASWCVDVWGVGRKVWLVSRVLILVGHGWRPDGFLVARRGSCPAFGRVKQRGVGLIKEFVGPRCWVDLAAEVLMCRRYGASVETPGLDGVAREARVMAVGWRHWRNRL